MFAAGNGRHRMLAMAVTAALMSGTVQAQEHEGSQYIHVSWTEKDGLPGSYIGSITQDRDGYLWLVANGALVRFDGVRFVEWGSIWSPALPRLRPSVVTAAQDGSLWIGLAGDGGAARLKDGRVTNYVPPSDASAPAGLVRSSSKTARGRFGPRASRVFLASATVDGSTSGRRRGSRPIRRTASYADQRGDIWAGTGAGVFRRAAGDEKFKLVHSSVRARGFAEDSSGTMWVTGLDHPFRTVEHPGRSPLPASLLQTASGGWALERDSKGNIWVATLGAGIWRVYDAAASPRIERFDRSQLSSAVVRSVLEDREGNIWVGTDNGLDRLTPSTLTARRHDVATINRPVTALTADQQGSVWVGTQTGLYRFTESDGRRFDQRDGLPGVAIYSLHTDARGTLWVAGDQLGLVRRLDDGRFSAVPLPVRPPLRIVAMTSDSSGALWLCDTDMGGVFRWKDGVLTEVPEVARMAAHSALTDRKGRVWIGLVNGILLVNRDGSKRIFGPDDGLGSGRVTALFEDARGAVWAATGVGVSRFDDGPNRFVMLPLRLNVTAIVEDRDSNLWLGVLNGIMRINRDDLDKSVADPRCHWLTRCSTMPTAFTACPSGSEVPRRRERETGTSGSSRLMVWRRWIRAPSTRKGFRPPVRIESIMANDRRLSLTDGLALPPRTSRLADRLHGAQFHRPVKSALSLQARWLRLRLGRRRHTAPGVLHESSATQYVNERGTKKRSVTFVYPGPSSRLTRVPARAPP